MPITPRTRRSRRKQGTRGRPRRSRRPGRPPEAAGVEGRESLLRAARELLTEKGLPGVTVREVAQRAGVGAALVGYYFGSKSGLFSAIVEQVIQEARGRLERVAAEAGSVAERIRGFLHEFVQVMRKDPYLPRLMTEHVLFAEEESIDRFAREFATPNLDLVRSLLQEGIESGELREVDPRLAVPTMVGSCIYFFLAAPLVQRLYHPAGITREVAETFSESTADIILRGLLARRAPA